VSARPLILGLVVGTVATALLVLFVGGRVAVSRRQNSLLERLYGDFAVEVATRTQGGGATNPLANDLGLRPGERELAGATREGRRGMPAYPTSRIGDARLAAMAAYVDTFPNRPRGRG
jgi:hypothetical protein